MISKDILQNKLKDKGFKVTEQRLAIIDVLLEHKNHFINAEEIYKKVSANLPKTNFSTIYRNLEIFEEIDIIHKTTLSGVTAIYELICNDEHHHHIICKNCGKTEIIDFCPFDHIKSQLNKKSFLLTGHKFELYGYCDKCLKK